MTKTTINWWNQAPELNDRQSENLNGGSGYTSISISGGLGAIQINRSDGAQVDLKSEHSTLKYRGYHNRHGYRSHYIY